MRKLLLLFALLAVLGTGCAAFSPPVIVNFSVNPASIQPGSSSTLIWNVTGANSVTIDPDIGNVAIAGAYTISPSTTTTYTITAANNAGTVTASALLTVNPAPQPPIITTFTANPSVISIGDTTALHWNVTGANSVTITPGIGAVSPSGSQNISPRSTVTYNLIATNSSGSVTSATVITVNPLTQPPMIADFSVSPSTVILGQSAVLYWNVSGTTNVYIDNGIGSVPPVGSQSISPAYFTTYTLTATNNAGTVTRSAYVDVWYSSPYPGPFPPYYNLPQIFLFDINPPVINGGASATISWQVSGASSIFIDHGIGQVPAAGTRVITPGISTVYTLTATNSFGSVNSTATVIVGLSSGSPAITSFTVSPTSIQSGQSATLQWSVNGATAISIDHGIGPVGPSGSRTVSPASSTTYTLTASNGTGMVMHTANLAVTPVVSMPVIGSFIATPASIETGHTSTLSWSITGATAVSISHGIGPVGLTGSVNVSPASTTTYTLTATSAAGSVVHSIQVNVSDGEEEEDDDDDD